MARHQHNLSHVLILLEDGEKRVPYLESETHDHDLPEDSVGPHTHYIFPPGGIFYVNSDGENVSGPLMKDGAYL